MFHKKKFSGILNVKLIILRFAKNSDDSGLSKKILNSVKNWGPWEQKYYILYIQVIGTIFKLKIIIWYLSSLE